MDRTPVIAALGAACLAVGPSPGQPPAARSRGGWKDVLAERLPALGHRNGVVIADSAYPAQARGGIETVVTNADQRTVVKGALAELAKAKHVRPVVYLDAELAHVPEADAPGIGK